MSIFQSWFQTGIGPVTFPQNFKAAEVEITFTERTEDSQPYKIKLEIIACVHGGSCSLLK